MQLTAILKLNAFPNIIILIYGDAIETMLLLVFISTNKFLQTIYTDVDKIDIIVETGI